METLLWTLFGITAVMAGITVVMVLFAIRAVRRSIRVVPDVPTRAPVAWRASLRHHARLHRQLQATVTSVRAALATSRSDLELRPLALELESHACALDDQLVVASRAPANQRARMLRELDAECSSLSEAGSRIIGLCREHDISRTGLTGVIERLDALDAALAELDDRSTRPASPIRRSLGDRSSQPDAS